MPPYALLDTGDPLAADCIEEIRAAFSSTRKKIFLIGAGASKSAGVSTFEDRHSILHKSGGRSILSESAFRTPEATAKYLHVVECMLEEVARAAPTSFHWMMDALVKRGDDVRVYTQNIDGLEFQCPRLSVRNVIAMHGHIRKMACPVCAYMTDMDITLFAGGQCPPCPVCPTREVAVHPERTRKTLPRPASKRLGCLRPFVLLYDSEPEGWAELDFSNARQFDILDEPAHTVVVAGTNLGVAAASSLASQFCSSAHKAHVDGLTIWLNPKDIPNRIRNQDMFDYAIKGTCDQFAGFLNL